MFSFTRTRGVAALLATGALVVGSLVAVAAPAYADDPVAGAQTAVPADTLFPNQGNGGYDVSHYDINLSVNIAVSSTPSAVGVTTFPAATASIQATTTGAPLSSYSFDFQGSASTLGAATLNVDTVTVNGVPATFSRIETTTVSSAVTDNHKLIITPATPVDGAFTTVVTYHGTPVRHSDTDGSFEGWNHTTDGATFLNQPIGAMTAFPVNNTPRDKATYTFTIDVPTKGTTSSTTNPGLRDIGVVSNGELVSRTPSADGSRTTWVWNEAKPMASELSMISIGRYDIYTQNITLASGRTIPEWTFIDPSISVANQTSTLRSRTLWKQLLDFYESKYGPYPGNSTGIVTDIVPSQINYALETQDRSFFPNTASGGTFYHEVMHQWFGDSVSPYDWNDIWLNEGPATLSESQVPFESVGSSTTTPEAAAFTFYSTASNNAMWATPVAAMTQASQLFGTPTYNRGAATLGALRNAIGQANFELLMKTWQSNYGGTSKKTADFIALAQTISGKDLTQFFNTWIYTTGKPAAWGNKFNYSVTQPSAALAEGGAFTLTLGNRNTGRAAEVGAVVSMDISDIVDDATIGTLPANVTQVGNLLSWAIPSTAIGASNSVAIPFTLNEGTTGHTLSGALTTGTTMLGGTCVNCSFSAVVGASEISPAPVPTISNTTPAYGQTLTVTPGTWADGTSLAYQWLVDGTPVSGATGTSFPLDVYTPGFAVTVQVTGTLAGSLPTIRTSAATALVTKPTQTGDTPTISGTPQIAKPLTASPGAGWLDGTYFTYQWAANGTNISGATGPSYIPTLATQIGQTFTVAVTGTKAGYTTGAAKLSAATAAAIQGVQVQTPTPTITGTGRAASAQTASPGQWDDNVALTYAWSLDGTPISGATAVTYTPTVAMVGQTLTVTVTGTRAGVTTESRTSAGTTILPGAQTLQPTPTVSGTPTVFQTLTLTPGTWDAGTSQTYQWSAGGIDIDGATGLTYVLQPADAGKTITASVTSTRSGYSTVVKTSLPTDAVALNPQVSTPTPTISGTAQVGETLNAIAGDWDSGVSLAYQWNADGSPIGGATGDSFAPGAAQIGAALTVDVTGTKSGFTPVTKTSDPTSAVLVGAFDPAPAPSISGTAKVGSELTAVTGTWDTDAELSFQWLADGEEIDGATESTYTPGPARVGAKISVVVTASAEGFTTVEQTTDETAAVVLGDLSATPDPTITGTAKVNVLLTAIPGDWDSGTTLSYQWYADGSAISGATSSEFLPGAGQVGAALSVSVTGVKDGFETIVKTSEETDEVVLGDLALTPTPSITGDAPQVGVQLTAVAGTWTTGTSLSYQWLADGDEISGATSTTFTPGSAQLGAEISVAVTGTKAGYTTVTKESPSTSEIQAGVQTLTPTPTIAGTPKFDVQLTGHAGTWDSGTALAYQWYADDDAISGATSLTFTPTAAQIGKAIKFEVTSTKSGYVTVTKASAPTANVAAATLTKSPVPAISGTPKIGTILSGLTSPWDSGVTLGYQWNANGTPVSGANASTFIPGASEVGKTITLSVTGTKSGYSTVTKTSAATKAVAKGTIAVHPTPVISGTARVGEMLTAVPGAWDAGTELSYQWRRNGAAITGATDDTYTLIATDRGKSISLVVTGAKPGYTSLSQASKAKAITYGIQTLQPTPGITGTLVVGSTLSIVPETHDTGVTMTYTWYVNNINVSTGPTLLLKAVYANKVVQVKSYAVKAGYTTVVKASLKTPKVGVIS